MTQSGSHAADLDAAPHRLPAPQIFKQRKRVLAHCINRIAAQLQPRVGTARLILNAFRAIEMDDPLASEGRGSEDGEAGGHDSGSGNADQRVLCLSLHPEVTPGAGQKGDIGEGLDDAVSPRSTNA